MLTILKTVSQLLALAVVYYCVFKVSPLAFAALALSRLLFEVSDYLIMRQNMKEFNQFKLLLQQQEVEDLYPPKGNC